ncbi:ABC transporter ATP-binding protein [Amycolatopsis pithecellobii]|uniref:ATP-binding cassette domain-containing protein n=1 Tax=Amycolatopsis pithecellobii TaxID=664692 RepID=A0A6N7YKF9_9PSEU|nr:ABC transporter ATP-binding protein [Amycolatopsis pithecellobii]MTD52502.1 ATP-binding cassette domain-containing protein [Amycolatopsis pithecellobii]
MLESRYLSVEFGGVAALADVTFTVAERSVLGLIGPNGAGKSTFIGAASGVVLPSGGTVTWRGATLAGKRPDQIARLGVGRTFQHARLFPGLTALENVMIGSHLAGRSGVFSAMLRIPRWRKDEEVLRAAAVEAMEAVHALHLAHRLSEDLTAGQQRLVAVARALAGGPSLLFLDEPAAGLTDAERELLAEDLKGYFATHDLTVLLVEHNLGFLMSLVSRIVVFDRGAVLAEGTPAGIRADPAVVDAYLGADHAVR